MQISPARQAAYRILLRIEGYGGFAADLLQSAAVTKLSDADRRLTTELVMGTMRWQRELDYQIERLSGKSRGYFDLEIRTILRLGVYQIRFLRKIPKPAAVDDLVELVKAARKRSATGLVNAVLRKCEPALAIPTKEGGDALQAGTSLPRATEELAESACRSLPEWLLQRWRTRFGLNAARDLALASVTVPRTTLRVRRDELQYLAELERQLEDGGVKTQRLKYARAGLVVRQGNIHSTHAWCNGLVMVQDEASQLIAELVAPQPDQGVLDLCAAPGIKTTQLAEAISKGFLVASDISARRLRTMVNILSRHAPASMQLHLVRLDAAQELPFSARFDRILLDAPCSGTGTLARNPEIKIRLQPHDLERLHSIQVRMLVNGLRALRPGGRLVYSTCSLECEENECVVEEALTCVDGAALLLPHALAQEFPNLASLFDQNGMLHTRPDLHHMDGFFAAVFRSKK